MASFESNVAWRFAPGSKLTLNPGEKTVTVGKDGDVKITDVNEGQMYVLESEGRRIQFTPKSDEVKAMGALERSAAEGPRLRELRRSGKGPVPAPLPSAAPGFTTTPNVRTGARSSVDVKARHQAVLTDQLDERSKSKEKDPDPAPNQLDVQGVPQRSDTVFGQATPVDPKEVQPYPSQDDVSGPQRSDTESGMATPVSKSEAEPAVSQEDAPKGLKQASSTEEGAITPTATEKGVKAEKARQSSTRKTGVKKSADLKAEKTVAKVKTPRKRR